MKVCFDGLVSTGLAVVLASAVLPGLPALAQQGFAIGREVQWRAPEPVGGSSWRAGLYSGTIADISGGGEKGSASKTKLIDIATGRTFWVRLDQINEIDCQRKYAKVVGYSKPVQTCRFGGSVSGTYGLDTLGWMRIALFEEVVLSDGTTTRSFSSYMDSFGYLTLGRGPNQWAKRASSTPSTVESGTATGTTPNAGGAQSYPPIGPSHQPSSPGVSTRVVPEVGQSYAQALLVGYPATIQANMTQGDYDTFLFDFAGGHFQAHSRSSLDLVADLLDAEGKMITRARAINGTFTFSQTLPSGRYGIIIRVMYHAGAGDYELVLGSGAGPSYRESR